MYPTISDLINDLFGIYIPLPVQTFGFFMALSFVAAYLASKSELKRKENDGLIGIITSKVKINSPITYIDYISSVIIGAFIGFKALEMFLDYDSLVANPQLFILSARGSWFGAIAGGALAYYSKNKESKKIEGKQVEFIEVKSHPYELMANVVAISAIAGILGAKIFHNLENIDELIADPFASIFSFSGLTFYGGLIVAAIAVLIYTKRNGIPNLVMMDATAPALILAYGVGRIGCHLSGDGDWGINNLNPKPEWLNFLPDWIWSFRYPHNVLSEGIPIPGCEGPHCSMLEFGVYPTPFYEVVMALTIFGILWAIRKKLKIPGLLFSVYLMFNGVERFFIEKIRINSTYHIFDHKITQAEIISSLLFLVGLMGVIYLNINSKKKQS